MLVLGNICSAPTTLRVTYLLGGKNSGRIYVSEHKCSLWFGTARYL